MKTISKLFLLICLCVPAMWLSSCSGEDGGERYELFGTWYGTRFYNNPASGINYLYLTLTLDSNHTGQLEYETPSRYSTAVFSWSVSGSYIKCEGAYANTDGEVESDFTMELKIEGDRLIPQNRYDIFILTKDNSVILDGDGNETTSEYDQINMLQNTWIQDDAPNIITFYSSTYEEYVLTSKGASTYSDFSTGEYTFSPYTKTLWIDTQSWEVKQLTNEKLVLKKGSSTFSYTRGSKSDIPTKPDLGAFLMSAPFGWSYDGYILNFYSKNSVRYTERSSKKLGSLGYVYLDAEGTFKISGNKVTCDFSDVWWERGNDLASNYFPGWTYGQSCSKTFVIEISADGEIMVTLPNGKMVFMKKVGI